MHGDSPRTGVILGLIISLLLAGRFIPAFLKKRSIHARRNDEYPERDRPWCWRSAGWSGSPNLKGMRALRSRVGLILAALPLLVGLSSCPGPRPVVVVVSTPVPEPATPAATPLPTPPPTPYVPNKRVDVGKIFNGMQIRTTLQTEFGTNATTDRADPSSYGVDLQVRVKVPKPHRDFAELVHLNSQLPTVLPELPILLNTAKISPFFDDLYRLKVTSLQQNLMHLDVLLSRHNFYDCETVLEFEHPLSRRRAILLQADMDTDNDGSDSDRVPDVDGSSATFQPFTSYKWAKKTQQPNSFITPRTARLRQIEQEMAIPGHVRRTPPAASRPACRPQIRNL